MVICGCDSNISDSFAAYTEVIEKAVMLELGYHSLTWAQSIKINEPIQDHRKSETILKQ